MLGRESLYRVEKKCVGRCAWQKYYNENVMVKFNYNVDKYIQTHWNTLNIESYYKCIEIYCRHIEIHHKYTISTFKYIQIYYAYIQIHPKYIVSTLKYIQIHYELLHSNIFKFILNTFKYTINI
jgi:hypothetical protein